MKRHACGCIMFELGSFVCVGEKKMELHFLSYAPCTIEPEVTVEVRQCPMCGLKAGNEE